MAGTLITDLVDPQALAQLKELDDKMTALRQSYTQIAKEMVNGIKINVEVSGDLDKLNQVISSQMQKASQATAQLNQTVQETQKVVANTTNTISRELAEQEKLNKAQREASTLNREALDIADKILGTREQNNIRLARLTRELDENKKAQDSLKKSYQSGMITEDQYAGKMATLMATQRELKVAKNELNRVLENEQKTMNASEGSYTQLSLQLERMKMAYKQLNEEEKKGATGSALEAEIQKLDAHLKDLSADMGEFQRNVGNYAIAGQSVKKQLKEMIVEIANLTIQYQNMSAEEQKSAEGVAMKAKIAELTEKAGELKDAIADVNEAVKHSASDTRGFDTITQGINVLISSFGLAQGAAKMFGISEEDLVEVQTKLQIALQASNALTVIQNALQRQSNLIRATSVIQAKALVAGEALVTAAQGKGVIATKAAAAAQAAFNLVAKANPYVLLATGIGLCVAAFIAYAAGSDKAKKADEDAAKAAKRRQQAEEELAQSYGNTAGELISKYRLLRAQWNALGNDFNEKQIFLTNHRNELQRVGAATQNVTDVESFMRKNTANVENAIKKRAMAMAAYAMYVKTAQQELEELEKLSTIKYRVYKEGQIADFKNMGSVELTQHQKEVRNTLLANGGLAIADNITLTKDQAEQMTKNELKKAQDENRKEQKRIQDEFEKQRENYWKKFVSNGGLSDADFEGAGNSGASKNTPRSSKGSSGGSNNAKNSPQVKTAEEIKEMIDKIILEAIQGQSEVLEEGTTEWAEKQKEYIKANAEADVAEATKEKEEILKQLEETHKQGKISDKDYNAYKEALEKSTTDRITAINQQMEKDLKEVEDKRTEYQKEKSEERLNTELDEIAKKDTARNIQYMQEVKRMEEEKQKAIENATLIGETTAEIEERYAKKREELENKYKQDTFQNQIDGLKKILDSEELTDDEKQKLAEELAKSEMDLQDLVTANLLKNLKKQEEDDKKSKEKLKEQAEEWLNFSTNTMSALTDLSSAIFDGKIQEIEDEQDANQEAYDQQCEQIDDLASRGAITEEEAEIRKREAKAQTEAKEEELAKKKAKLQYKQALVEKANNIAQIGIQTALAIMKAAPNWVQVGMVSALGAIQLATAIAQPIKAYAEGTKGRPHVGGIALVGDGGQQEVVSAGGQLFLTPSTPTLIDLPKGAEVYPNIEAFNRSVSDIAMLNGRGASMTPVVVNNDYSELNRTMERSISENTRLLGNINKQIRHNAYMAKYEAYKRSRI